MRPHLVHFSAVYSARARQSHDTTLHPNVGLGKEEDTRSRRSAVLRGSMLGACFGHLAIALVAMSSGVAAIAVVLRSSLAGAVCVVGWKVDLLRVGMTMHEPGVENGIGPPK